MLPYSLKFLGIILSFFVLNVIIDAKKIRAPFGSWKSEITSETLSTSESSLYANLRYGEKTGTIFWISNSTIYSVQLEDVLQYPKPNTTRWLNESFNPVSKVHDYGGGAMTVSKFSGFLYFTNSKDQAIYELQSPMKYLYAIEEDHNIGSNPDETQNRIVQINIVSLERDFVANGANFYVSPVVSDDGSLIAWMEWNFPNMPWDATEIWLAQIDACGVVTSQKQILGDDNTNYMQPQFYGNELHVISDQSGFWNVYRINATDDISLQNIAEINADIGEPLWRLGQTNYKFAPGYHKGRAVLLSKNTTYYIKSEGEPPINVKTGLTEFNADVPSGSIIFPRDNLIVMFGSSPVKKWGLYLINLESKNITRITGGSNFSESELASTSIGEPIDFRTSEGMIAHAILYEPKNANYESEKGELPPLLVCAHGGPTARTSTNFQPQIQYWTQKGFVVLDLDYRGSTGYGREYRDLLYGKWGIRDLEDAEYGVDHLIKAGKIDVKRTAISGSSAGGYLALRAMTDGKNRFMAAVSKYGISDLKLLDEETHKFESEYLKQVIGDSDEYSEILEERSPIHDQENITNPIGFFHGNNDTVVPPNQAQIMYEAIKQKKLPTFLVMFEGEGHGFQQNKNIELSIDGEYFFYCKVFGITPSIKVEDERVNFGRD